MDSNQPFSKETPNLDADTFQTSFNKPSLPKSMLNGVEQQGSTSLGPGSQSQDKSRRLQEEKLPETVNLEKSVSRPKTNMPKKAPKKNTGPLKNSSDEIDEFDVTSSTNTAKLIATNQKRIDEEIIVKCDVTHMAKLFLQKSQIVWFHEPEIKLKVLEQTDYMDKLEKITKPVTAFTVWNNCLEHIRLSKICCFVIVSSSQWQKYVEELEKLDIVSHICLDLKLSSQEVPSELAQKKKQSIDSRLDCITTGNLNDLTKLVETAYKDWETSGSSKKMDLPALISLRGEKHSNEIFHNHWALQILTKFQSRDQAKQDFIDLAKEITKNTKETLIDEFIKGYNSYNLRQVLNWYTRESFLYKLTNNCLRIATPDSIQYCRIILKDLQQAIKELYENESKNFSGLLYRGAYISNDEWEDLKLNIGEDLEMHGFLSTSKDRSIAEKFASEDPSRKALITIIVPKFPDFKEVSGFAEIKEFSDFQEEDEVLFNIMSRFTVEAVTFEEVDDKKYRHLVLVYGGHALRRYMRETNPTPKIEVNKTKETSACLMCNQGFEDSMAINLYDQSRCFCLACVDKLQPEDKAPLVIMNSHDLKNGKVTVASAYLFKYRRPLESKFYGERYKCASCGRQPEQVCYTETNASELGKRFCSKCFNLKSYIIKSGSYIIIEKNPFAVHFDIMKDQEFANENYQRGQYSKIIKSNFSQGELFLEIERYDEAIRYYEKFLDTDTRRDLTITATAFSQLASAYKSKGSFNDAIEFYARALEIRLAASSGRNSLVAESYENLGMVYYSSCNYLKALKYCEKALEIRIQIGEQDLKIAESYNNTGDCCSSLGRFRDAAENYQKALEIKTTMLGENHPDTATSLSTLGNCYKKLSEFQKALEKCNKTLEVRRSLFGMKHPDTATAIEDIGIIYSEIAKYSEALEHLKKSLDIRLELFNDEDYYRELHASLLEAEAVRDSQNPEEIISQKMKQLILNIKADDPHIAQSLHNIGLVYENMANYDAAREWYEKALAMKKSSLGTKHIETAITYDSLSSVFEKLYVKEVAIKGDSLNTALNTALEYANNALDIKRNILGDRHPDLASTYTNLGYIYQKRKGEGDDKKVVRYFSLALTIKQTSLGDDHSETATSHKNIGITLFEMEEYDKAMSHFMIALNSKKKVFGEHHPDFVVICDKLGYCQLLRKEYESAYKNFEKADENVRYYSKLKNAEAKNYSRSKSAEIVDGDKKMENEISKYYSLLKKTEAIERYKNMARCLGSMRQTKKSLNFWFSALKRKDPDINQKSKGAQEFTFQEDEEYLILNFEQY